MNKQRRAIDAALDVFIRMDHDLTKEERRRAFNFCVEALVELGDPEKEPEPVAWLSQGGDVSRSKKHFDEMGFVDSIPLYMHPPARKALSGPHLFEMWSTDLSDDSPEFFNQFLHSARMVELAHGIGELSRDAMANSARTCSSPLSDERIDEIIASNVAITDRNLHGAVYMAMRQVEEEHGIEE